MVSPPAAQRKRHVADGRARRLWYGRRAVLDVIVMGAGLAGLAAARDLARAARTCSCWRPAAGSAGGSSRPSCATGGWCSSAARSSGRSTPPTAASSASSGYARAQLRRRAGRLQRAARRGRLPRRRPALADGGRARRPRPRRRAVLRPRPGPSTPTTRGPSRRRPPRRHQPRRLAARGRRDAGHAPHRSRSAHLRLSTDRPERWSLLAELRKQAAAGATGFYDADVWENERVAEGSADGRAAHGRGARRPRAARRRRCAASPSCPAASSVLLDDGEELVAERRGLRAAGRPAARRGARRASTRSGSGRCAASAAAWPRRSPSPTSGPFWRDAGPQRARRERALLRLDVAAARGHASRSWCRPSASPGSCAAPPDAAREAVLDEVAALYGAEAREPVAYFTPPVGRRPVHARLRHRLGAGRPDGASARGTARTRRRSGSAAPTSGSPATWRAPCARGARRPPTCSASGSAANR